MSLQLLHILDQSSCLTKRQMTDYARGIMTDEEAHALETHLNACPLCSAAIDGMLMHGAPALEAVGELSAGFIKEHFDRITPQIHLNSMAAVPMAEPSVASQKAKKITFPGWQRNLGIAASILLAFGLLWYWQYGRDDALSSAPIAANMDAATPASPAGSAAAPAGEDNSYAGEATGSSLSRPALEADKYKDAGPAESVTPGSTALSSQPGAGNMPSADRAEIRDAEPASARSMAAPPPAPKPAPAVAAAPQPDARPAGRAGKNAAPTTSAAAKATDVDAEETITDHLEEGNARYEDKDYRAAVGEYKKDMASTDAARRQKATVMAARSYANMGQKAKAIQLLQGIVAEGGPEKRTARRLLRQLQEEQP